MRKFIFLIIFQLLASFVVAQKDVEFWFATPVVYLDTAKNIVNEPLRLRVTPVGSSTTVECTLSMPKNSSASPQPSGPINFGRSWIYDIPPAYYKEGNEVSNPTFQAVCLKCTDSVMAFLEAGSEDVVDIYPLKGANALGDDFVIPWHNRYFNDTIGTEKFLPNAAGEFNPPFPPRNRFDVVSPKDVSVRIKPSKNLYANIGAVGAIDDYYPAEQEIIPTAKEGVRTTFLARDTTAEGHLGGTTLTGGTMAVMMSDNRLINTSSGTINFVGEQMVPSSKLGKSFIAMKGMLNEDDQEELYIAAVEDTTTIYLVNDAIAGDIDSLTTINRGEVYKLDFPTGQDAMYFKSNRKMSIYQHTGIGDYFAGAQLPPIPCTGYDTIGYNRTSNDTLVFCIYVEKRGRGTFAFNGDSTIIKEADFLQVPGTDTVWWYAKVGIPNDVLGKDSTVILSNDILFHLSVLEGGESGKGAKYGFLTKYDQIQNMSMITNKTLFCEGDTMSFQLADYYNLKNIEWLGPDSLNKMADSIHIYKADTVHTGIYYVEAETINFCDLEFTQKEVKVYVYPEYDLGSNRSLCEGDITFSIAKDSVAGYTYKWSTGNDTTASIIVDAAGEYSVAVRNGVCSTFDTVMVSRTFIPTLTIDSVGDLCEDLQVELIAKTTAPNYFWDSTAISTDAKYQWRTSETDSSIIARDTGTYVVKVSYFNCSKTDSIRIAPRVPRLDINKKGHLCEWGDTLSADGDGWTFLWSNGDTNQFTVANDTGTYWVRSYINFCESTDTVEVSEVIPKLEILEVGGHLCKSGGLELQADPEYNGRLSFLWSDGTTNQTFAANDSGMYWVEVHMNNCIQRDTIEIDPIIPWVKIDTSGNLCETGVTLDATSEYPGTNFRWNTPDITKEILRYDYGMYWVEVHMNNCVNRDTIEIEAIIPWVKIEKSGDLCRTGITLDATSEYTGTNFRWNTPDITKEIHKYNYGTYWVEVSMNNCVNRDTIEILEERPSVEITKTGDICDGVLVLEAVTEADQFLWSTNSTTNPITIDTFGVFWVEVKMNECVNSDTIEIERAKPNLEIVKSNELCRDGYVILEAVTDASIYRWSTGEITRQIAVDTGGLYSVNVYKNNCTNVDSVEIQRQMPTLEIVQEGDLCKNRYLKLTADSDAWEFLWSTGEKTPEIEIIRSGTFWVTVNINDCYTSDTLELNINQPVAKILPDVMPAEGCEPFDISFENLTENATTYLWDFGDGTTSKNKEIKHTYKSGLYKLAFMAYTADGCMDSVMMDVQAFSAPKPDFVWNPTYPTVKEPAIQFINKTESPSNENAYIWKFQTDKNNPNAIEYVTDSIDAYYQWNSSTDNLAQGTYLIELVSTSINEGTSGEIYECSDSISYEIRILNDFLQFPNVVTPNGDGVNDVFEITNLIDGLAFPNNELTIYDRSGRRIYQKKNIKIESEFWDPKSTNTLPGTYIYHFVGKGHKLDVEYNGTIEVLMD